MDRNMVRKTAAMSPSVRWKVCAMALTNPGGELTAELFAQLRQHFSEPDILELGTVMAVISGMAKLSFVLDVVDKESYCPFAPGR